MECSFLAEVLPSVKKKKKKGGGRVLEDGRKFAFTPLLYSEIFKIYISLFFQVHGISQHNKNNRVHAKY